MSFGGPGGLSKFVNSRDDWGSSTRLGEVYGLFSKFWADFGYRLYYGT